MKLLKHVRLALVVVASASLSLGVVASEYKPLFSKEQLDAADPERRSRMVAMDRENRERWERRQGIYRSESDDRADTDNATTNAPVVTATTVASSGGVYRYRDKHGNVQFSDKPVVGAERVEVATQKPGADARRAAEKRLDDQHRMITALQESRKVREEIRLAEAKEADRKAELDRECRRLLNDIQDFRRGGVSYYELDANGDRKFFNDAELAAKVSELESSYQEHCGDLP